jgi:hypothetical protein
LGSFNQPLDYWKLPFHFSCFREVGHLHHDCKKVKLKVARKVWIKKKSTPLSNGPNGKMSLDPPDMKHSNLLDPVMKGHIAKSSQRGARLDGSCSNQWASTTRCLILLMVLPQNLGHDTLNYSLMGEMEHRRISRRFPLFLPLKWVLSLLFPPPMPKKPKVTILLSTTI